MTLQEVDSEVAKDPELMGLAKNDPTEFKSQYSSILKFHGMNENGAPLGLVDRGANAIERLSGIPAAATKGAGAMGLSMAGTVAGATVGAVGGPATAIGGAMVGSFAGDKAAEYAGLRSKMDMTDTALSLGMPTAGTIMSRGLQGAKYLSRWLPNAGVAISELAGDTAEQAVKRVRVPQEAVDSARYVMNSVDDFKIRMPKLTALLDNELKIKARAANLPGVEADIAKLNKVRSELGAPGDGDFMSFNKMMAWEKELNELKTEDAKGVWKKASGILIQDIQDAANNPSLSKATREKASQGFTAFKQFVTLNKAYKADTELTNMLNRAYSPSAGDPALYKFDSKSFMKTLETNATIKDAFTPDEIKGMKDAVVDLGYITHPPSGGQLSQVMGGAMGPTSVAGAAYYAGQPHLAIASATLAAIALAIKSPMGRSAIKTMATTGKGRVNSLELTSTIGKLFAGGTTGAVAGVTGAGEQNTASPDGTNQF